MSHRHNPVVLPDGWEPMATAPRDQTKIEVLLPGENTEIAIWAWGGGWAAEWDKQRPRDIGGWATLNDSQQPLGWRHADVEQNAR